jgi:hypothetical protein
MKSDNPVEKKHEVQLKKFQLKKDKRMSRVNLDQPVKLVTRIIRSK